MESLDIGRIEATLKSLAESAIHFGVQLVIAILILIVGLWIAKKITKSLRKMLTAKNVEPSLRTFLLSLVNISLKIMVFIIVLATVGVQMTSIIAVIGAASLAVGMALSGTFQNLAGGVVILFLKPFKVGDFIEAQSNSGTVESISIFTTRIKTGDNKVIYLPNGALSNGSIINYNQDGKRRADSTFGIAYGDNVAKAREVLLDILSKDERVIKDPVPVVFLTNLADSSVNVMVRFWATPSDILPIQFDLNEKVYIEFGKNGLSFPFPQMDVHLNK